MLDVVLDYLRREAEVGGYELATRSAAELEAVYASLAQLVGAAPDEIATFEGATQAWAVAFASICFEPGDRILLSRAEYVSSVLSCLRLAQRMDVSVEVVPDDEHGQLDVAALSGMLDERVRLVAVTHVPTNSGLVNPVEVIGSLLRETDAMYLVDACQSVGQMVVDVEAIGCDLLSSTGRKFLRAPRGTGFLYVRRSALDRLDPIFVDLRAATWVAADRYEFRHDARRFETWERNVATTLGLGTAADYARSWGLDSIARRVGQLSSDLRKHLDAIGRVEVRDPGRDRCGIVTFTIDGVDPEVFASELRSEGINVWFSNISTARLDFEARGLESVVRASIHYYNTEDELDRLIEAVGTRAQ